MVTHTDLRIGSGRLVSPIGKPSFQIAESPATHDTMKLRCMGSPWIRTNARTANITPHRSSHHTRRITMNKITRKSYSANPRRSQGFSLPPISLMLSAFTWSRWMFKTRKKRTTRQKRQQANSYCNNYRYSRYWSWSFYDSNYYFYYYYCYCYCCYYYCHYYYCTPTILLLLLQLILLLLMLTSDTTLLLVLILLLPLLIQPRLKLKYPFVDVSLYPLHPLLQQGVALENVFRSYLVSFLFGFTSHHWMSEWRECECMYQVSSRVVVKLLLLIQLVTT